MTADQEGATMPVTSWMSWEGGVDLVAATAEGLGEPNVVVHVARMVHTPVGSAPAGMIAYRPDPDAAPVVIGFISADAAVAAYFGPNVFGGTPFEAAPTHVADIVVEAELPTSVRSRIEVAGHVFETELGALGPLERIDRPAGEPMPFHQHGLEAVAAEATLTVDGEPVPLVLPAVGLSGGPPAVWAPAGQYTRG